MENKNNFEDYGFNAEFEGEIFKEIDDKFYGVVMYQGSYHTITWNKIGKVLNASNSLSNLGIFNLTLIKTPWYEIEDNFPCVVIQIWDEDTDESTNKPRIATSYNKEYGYLNCIEYIDPVLNFRLATKEEVLNLYIKEN